MRKKCFMLTISFLIGLLPLCLLWFSSVPVQAAQIDDRLVMKEANLALMVPDTGTAVQTAEHVEQCGGDRRWR